VRENRRLICAIHQPNFFPWLGYFDKIARADVFLLMDNVQYPKKSGTWINRVRLLSGGSPYWATAPLDRKFHGTRLIQDSLFSLDDTAWRARLRRSIEMQYAKAAHFAEVFPIIDELLMFEADNIAEYNINAITGLCSLLGLDVGKLRRGSSLQVDGNATSLLIQMCQAVDANAYLCGGGASGYQEDDAFREAGIELLYQNFEHPVYAQGKVAPFQSGLSTIDALMHCGIADVREMLGAECRQ